MNGQKALDVHTQQELSDSQ